jgi:pilus assembly protein CpaF
MSAPVIEPTTAVDYALAAEIQVLVAGELAELDRAHSGPPLASTPRRELARQMITRHVAAHADRQATHGRTFAVDEEINLVQAVFASMFGLARLETLVADPTVENIDASGCDEVWVEYSDGRVERSAPIASSDEDLVALIQRLAGEAGQSAREFSTARPLLNLRIPVPGNLLGARVSATMAVCPRPQLSIRKWRLAEPTLADLQRSGTMSPTLANFLAAAVRARHNIMITGEMSCGKTTLLRALAAEIPRLERFATIETEFELGLHLLPHRHPRVYAVETREGTADAPGSSVDQYALITHALRQNVRRVIVGEARAEDVIAMLDVMANGCDGSMCTVHTRSGQSAVDRVVELATRGGRGLSESTAQLLIAGSVDFIVHLRLRESFNSDGSGSRERFIDEVSEVAGRGEGGRPALNQLFGPGPDGRAVPRTRSFPHLAALVETGFDAGLLLGSAPAGDRSPM